MRRKTSIDNGRIALKKFLMHQESGFLWDLYFIFYLRFNYQVLSEKASSYKKTAECTELYREIQLRFGNLPEELYVFFHTIEIGEQTFFDSCCLKSLETDFVNKYNIDYLQQELADHNCVVGKMIAFYFDAMEDQQLAECLNSKDVLFDHIKASNYSIEEKLKLYEFFMNPAPYIMLLQRTLSEKQSLLSDYYKAHYKDIIDAYDPIALNALNEKMKNNGHGKFEQEKTEYVSYCLLDRFHFRLISNQDAYLYVLGTQYESVTKKPAHQTELPLEAFGHALCEKNRVDILNLLREQKEVTCKDLERFFDFSGSTAYHHLSLMSKAGLLKVNSKGKTIYYSIDKHFMKDVIELLKKYIQS